MKTNPAIIIDHLEGLLDLLEEVFPEHVEEPCAAALDGDALCSSDCRAAGCIYMHAKRTRDILKAEGKIE